jgi:hypothetical protein
MPDGSSAITDVLQAKVRVRTLSSSFLSLSYNISLALTGTHRCRSYRHIYTYYYYLYLTSLHLQKKGGFIDDETPTRIASGSWIIELFNKLVRTHTFSYQNT